MGLAVVALVLGLALPALGQDAPTYAESADVVPPSPEESGEILPAEPPPPPTAAELLDQTRRRFGHGDYVGARILLHELMEHPVADLDETTYLLGLSWEFDGDPSQALLLYDQGLLNWPASPRTLDRTFRKAEAYAALEEHEAAIAWLHLIDPETLQPEGQRKYALVEGTLLVASDPRRKHLELLAHALSAVESGEMTYYEGRARAAICHAYADEAAALGLDVGQRRQRKRLMRRAELIDAVERQVTAIADLSEPEWVLDGLLTLGGAYQAIGTDLLEAPVPRTLNDGQRAMYDAMVRERVFVVWRKSMQAYSLGLDLSDRLGWTSPRVSRLETAHDAMVKQIEGL